MRQTPQKQDSTHTHTHLVVVVRRQKTKKTHNSDKGLNVSKTAARHSKVGLSKKLRFSIQI